MQTQPEVRYVYVARTQLKIGDTVRQPGEAVPEAAEWPNLDDYLRKGHIEQFPVLGTDNPHAVLREERGAETYAPEGYDELTPTPGEPTSEYREELKHQQFPGPGRIEVSCINCKSPAGESLNYVPEEKSRFQCWVCGQQQQVADALTYPAPSLEDFMRAGVRPGGR